MNNSSNSPRFAGTYVRKLGSLLMDWGNQMRVWALNQPEPAPASQKKRQTGRHLALVAGYFSFPNGYATFGDTEAMKIVATWLESMQIDFDLACHHSNGKQGVSLHHVDPQEYDIFIFVCGPWRSSNLNILEKFKHCIKIGVNLSIEDTSANRFDLLYPRDLPDQFNPDIVFSAPQKDKPLIGICLVHGQTEYGERQRHQHVNQTVHDYLAQHDYPFIYLDTLHKNNPVKIPNTDSFESLLRRVDVVISSRLHGTVFSLKNGTPVVAIDAIAGGAKLTNQTKALEWPVVLNGDDLLVEHIDTAVRKCLTPEFKMIATKVKLSALQHIREMEIKFKRDLAAQLQI